MNPVLRRLGRLVSLVALVLLVFTATRGMVRLLPGDPIETLIAESGTAIPVETLRHDLALDRPFWQSTLQDAGRFLRGDFGTSLITRRPIAPLLAQRFAATLQLAALALSLGLIASIALGVCAAAQTGSTLDRFCSWYGGVAAALPLPWLGPALMVALCVWVPLFPAGGHVLLPAIALAAIFTGLWARLIRERVRETLATGAAPGARARGVPEWIVLLKYGLAPCAGALAAYFGTQFGGMLAGALVVETIFDWPGMGALLVEAVLKRDYPIVEAGTFLAATCALTGNALGDWLQTAIDPRLSVERPAP